VRKKERERVCVCVSEREREREREKERERERERESERLDEKSQRGLLLGLGALDWSDLARSSSLPVPGSYSSLTVELQVTQRVNAYIIELVSNSKNRIRISKHEEHIKNRKLNSSRDSIKHHRTNLSFSRPIHASQTPSPFPAVVAVAALSAVGAGSHNPADPSSPYPSC
jgi:hypothetical protein